MNFEESNLIIQELGEPERFVYKAHPVLLYRKCGSDFMKSEFICVSFERACDLFETEQIEEGEGVADPFIVSEPEPGINPVKQAGLIVHDVFLTYDKYCKLRQFTNMKGHLRRYTGVIEGYDTMDIAKFAPVLSNTNGLWLDDEAFDMGFVRYPVKPFDEKKHTRFIQASYSHAVKEERRLQNCRKI